jgi:geranylgeranyl diphosphate synthase type I
MAPENVVVSRKRSITIDVDDAIELLLRDAVAALDGVAPLLPQMARYHLGWFDESLTPVANGSFDRGKRFRPLLALLCAGAAGGQPETAAPLAAAVELLHNFTLVHDDIQDESQTRRHRPTVWAIWGASQAINAGDALFAAAHLALYRLRDSDVNAELVLELADAFDRMTIEIVEGQVLDLGFELRRDVAPDEYLTMIAGKTSAIVRYTAWAGALLGGADRATAARYAEFGLALGLGFQVQDDLLGIWGMTARTGKPAADDIRRKKQSLPVLMLRDTLTSGELDELEAIYRAPAIDPNGITAILALLDRHGIRERVEAIVRAHHDEAIVALDAACADAANPYKRALLDRIESLATRSH